MSNYVSSISNTFDNQQRKTYNAQEVGEIFCYMLQSMGYSFRPMNLDNGIAQAIKQPLATPRRMTMTVDEVSQELNVSKQKVYSMIHQGELPARRVGKRYVISRSALEMWIENQVQEETYNEAG